MLSHRQETLLGFAEHPKPFQLLHMEASGKTLEQLYDELTHRAQREFLEHCYRSKKAFSFADFRRTDFFLRYCFLRRHLDLLSSWLYSHHQMPIPLQKARWSKPCYDNPWGLKALPGRRMETLSLKKTNRRDRS